MKGDRSPVLRFGVLLVSLVLALPALAADRIRPGVLAGTWYPAEPQELSDYIDSLLDAAKPEDSETPVTPVRALIAPHAGYPFSGAAAAKVFALVRGREYKRVIVLAPSHHSGFRGLSIADVDAYQTPLGEVPLDAPAVAELRKSDLAVSDPIAHAHEHSIEIELPFLQRTLKPGWRLVPVLVGQLEREDYKKAAGLLRPLADADTLVVVSSDFTHFGPRFGYMPFPVNAETPEKIRALDDGAVKQILALDATGILDYQERTGITICGYRPLALLLTLLPPDAEVRQIAYATSGELTSDWGNSVSYVGMLVTGPTPISGGPLHTKQAGSEIDKGDLALLHRLAVLGVQEAVLGPSDARSTDIRKIVEGLAERLEEPSGAFVTLKEEGQLRGCIGYILPRKPLYQAVLENGFNAARNDPRFTPVRPDELSALEIDVSVLSKPRPIASYDQFKVGEEGVILSKEGHQAVFLPEVATEQGWTREDTLSHLSLKAGLPADAWREGASFEVFTSTQYSAGYPTPKTDSEAPTETKFTKSGAQAR